MAFARSFRELDVYQNALQLALDMHRHVKGLPRDEVYVMGDQVRRASRSVCANISEAWRKRRYKAAFIAKLSDAETEAAEMQCWLDLAKGLSYLKDEVYAELDRRYEKVLAQIVTMIGEADKWCRLT